MLSGMSQLIGKRASRLAGEVLYLNSSASIAGTGQLPADIFSRVLSCSRVVVLYLADVITAMLRNRSWRSQ